MTEPGPVTELEMERHCYLLALQRRATGDRVPRPGGVERIGEPAASLGPATRGDVHWYTRDPHRHVLYRARWGEATLRLDLLDRASGAWVLDPTFLERISGRKPDDSVVEIDEDEARRIADSLLPSSPR